MHIVAMYVLYRIACVHEQLYYACILFYYMHASMICIIVSVFHPAGSFLLVPFFIHESFLFLFMHFFVCIYNILYV